MHIVTLLVIYTIILHFTYVHIMITMQIITCIRLWGSSVAQELSSLCPLPTIYIFDVTFKHIPLHTINTNLKPTTSCLMFAVFWLSSKLSVKGNMDKKTYICKLHLQQFYVDFSCSYCKHMRVYVCLYVCLSCLSLCWQVSGDWHHLTLPEMYLFYFS